MEKISFIIISFNRPTETIDALHNVAVELEDMDGFEKEIILINNGSTVDYSSVEQYLRSHPFPHVHYINHGKNLGVSGGRNLGIQHASGKYVVFLDDDAVFQQKDALATLHDRFSKDHTLGIIGFGVYNFYTGVADHPIKQKRKAKGKEFYNAIFWGCGFAVRRDLFKRVGNFDASFFYGMEEYDLSYRAIQAGYTILFTQSISVLHKLAPQGREKNKMKVSRLLMNKSLVAYRYLPWVYVLTHIVMWSGYLLMKTRGDVLLWLRSIRLLLGLVRSAKRTPLSEESMAYIRSTPSRLTY